MIGSAILVPICKEFAMKRRTLLTVLAALPLVPGASGYLDSAKKLGAVTGPLKNLEGLNGALGKLGMNADTVAQFTPLVTNYLGKLGGPTVQNLLAGALQ
jgi:hypothetical protein